MRAGIAIIVVLAAIAYGTRSKTNDKSPKNKVKYNGKLSTPEECARACRENEYPKTCYYNFTVELYMILGAACQVCTPNTTDHVSSSCQCILADGVERSMMAVNRMLPGPSIQVCENDRVIIDVYNKMDGFELTIHWHGMHQRGTQYYDGMPYVTQCPIASGTRFRYQWTASDPGTHFWHAHSGLHKAEGVYGSIVIRQSPNRDPSSGLYRYDLRNHVMLLSDWTHNYTIERFPGRLTADVGQTAKNVLINGKGQYTDPESGLRTNTPLAVFTITSGQSYRFRMIASSFSVCPLQLNIEGHPLTLVASDGSPVQPIVVNTIIAFSGERFDFVINANQSIGAYWIHVRALGECIEYQVQQVGVLRYTNGPYQPSTAEPTYNGGFPNGVILNPIDGECGETRKNAVCINQLKNALRIISNALKNEPDFKFYLPYRFLYYKPEEFFIPNRYDKHLVAVSTDVLVSLIDGICYSSPPSPPLSQINDISPRQFCNSKTVPPNSTCTHILNVDKDSVVEIILVDEVAAPNLSHPFHLHGYSFYVTGIGRLSDSRLKKMSVAHVRELDSKGMIERSYQSPPSKDTVAVPNNGFMVIRIKADNPGYWFFHCHFLLHIIIGMNFILHVGQQNDLPPVPRGFPRCGNFLPPIEN